MTCMSKWIQRRRLIRETRDSLFDHTLYDNAVSFFITAIKLNMINDETTFKEIKATLAGIKGEKDKRTLQLESRIKHIKSL